MKLNASEMKNMKENKSKLKQIEVKQSLSKDGKWFITRTIITDLKSVKYIEKVLERKDELDKIREELDNKEKGYLD